MKSILVDNKSAHAITLFILPTWSKFRCLSYSIIVERSKSFLFEEETAFQFELGARPKGEKMQTIWSARMWEKDMLLRVTGDHEIHVQDEELAECKQKQICIRRQNMAKEVSAAESKNLYEILNLDMEEVRGEPLEEQNKIIKKAYHSQLRRWHPDRNPENGDSAICQEINFANTILKDPEARAAYNNVADFDKGWLSRARYKAIFMPECCSAEQKKQYGKRMGLLFLSSLLIAGGIGLTFLTAGMAAPVALGMTAASGALIGGGISSGLRTINREAIEKGCSFRKYSISLMIGAVGGAVIGVGVAGIAMLGGAAKLAFKAAQLSLERQISTRIATTAFRGLITSLTNNIDAILAGGQKTSWKQFILHVLLDAWLGGIVGLAGGLVENTLQGVVSVEDALITFETVSSNICDAIEDTTTIAAETFANFVKERLDDDVENKAIVDHIKNGATHAAMAVGKNLAKVAKKVAKKVNDGGKAPAINDEFSNQDKATDGIYEETNDETKKDTNNTTPVAKNVIKTAEKEGINPASEYNDSTRASDDIGGEVEDSDNAKKKDKCKENIDNDAKTECTGRNDSSAEYFYKFLTALAETSDNDDFTDQPLPCYKSLIAETNDNDDFTERVEHRLKYISKGHWFSKMLVDYEENGETKHNEVNKDSENSIPIPNKSTNIKVRFQVMRFPGIWCDVKKYDRFKKCWIEPSQTHTFEYNTPVSRTYTLTGNLYYEVVTKIDNNDFSEYRLKHISDGPWVSQMLVDYEDNGKSEHEVKGSKSSIRIPNKATNIKVRFQVMRFPGIWCDVKKYDRFKKCWIEPSQTHTFEYNTPVSRTYTLTGKLYYEAVTKITVDYNDINEI